MATGLGVFLTALGAVLAFAVKASIAHVDLFLVGAILMLVGATIVAMSMMHWTPRRRPTPVAYAPRERVHQNV